MSRWLSGQFSGQAILVVAMCVIGLAAPLAYRAEPATLPLALPTGAQPLGAGALRSGYRCSAVAFSPDSRRMASVHDGGAINVWDVATGQRTATFEPGAG